MLELIRETIIYVGGTLAHNAPYLTLGILVAAIMKVYVDPERLRQWLLSHSRVSIPGSVIFGAFTPFCACGTMAVVISLLATALPWGPIMAFLVSSPLMSPDEFIFFAGILGVKFASVLTIASIGIGLAGGYLAHAIEKHTHFLDDQIRFTAAKAAPGRSSHGIAEAAPAPACGCSVEAPAPSCGCSGTAAPTVRDARNEKLLELLHEMYDIGVKKVLVYFSLFAAIGFFVNKLVPAELVMALFNGSHWYAVPLAALVGLPLYVTGASALPLLQVLMTAGASSGAVLAFLITGPATSVGVIAGIATIMKQRAIALYIAIILVGGIIAGYGYDLVLHML